MGNDMNIRRLFNKYDIRRGITITCKVHISRSSKEFKNWSHFFFRETYKTKISKKEQFCWWNKAQIFI